MYENLCLEGGGMKALAYCGALYQLEKQNILSNIKRVSGTSIGSFFAALVAVGFNGYEIKGLYDDIDTTIYSLPNICNCWSIFCNFGINDNVLLEEQLASIISIKVNPYITLEELWKKTEKELVIVSCCLNRRKPIYFHHATYPSVPLIEAVVCSMIVPIAFRPRINNFFSENDYYIDGGIIDNYPIWVFNDLDALYKGKINDINRDTVDKNTLGIKLLGKDERNTENVYQGRANISNIFHFIKNLVDTLMLQIERVDISPEYIKQTIPIKTNGIHFLDFDMTEETKKQLIQSGIESVKHYFGTNE